MAKYVKFLRGSPEAFAKLKHKDSDTLYFIYEEDESSGELYLGSKLIAGADCDCSGGSNGINKLSDLKDVLLSQNLNHNSVLVYDTNAVAWVNKPLEDLIFVGATQSSKGLVGLVPAPEQGQTELFLRSDGTWALPSAIANSHLVLTLENKDQSTHTDLILAAAGNIDAASGDIIIIKDLIINDKWQYTAYVYDNGVWRAMDGNYNAENVYFDEDLITTTEIGNITLKDGQAVIKTAGKNLKEVFETIYVKERNPKITQPYIALTCNEMQEYEVGSLVIPTYEASLYKGKYEFGPDTEVHVNAWSIVDNEGGSSLNNKGEFKELQVKDDTNYNITATVSYSDGDIPLTNLGNDYLEGQIIGTTISTTKTFITGYRNSFYGALAEKEILTSDVIRSLNAYNAKMTNNASQVVNLPIGTKRVVFAYPATLPDLVSVNDKNGFDANIVNSFKLEIIAVEGNKHYSPIDYKVYSIDFANPYNTTNYYTFTIGEED